MDSGLTKTIGLGIVTAVLATFVALADSGANEAAGTVAVADTTHHDSAVTVHWMTDGNVTSLLTAIDSRQSALANAELQAWHSDTVRAFAADMVRGTAELQHTTDSLAAKLRLSPAAPAMQDSLVAALQARIDTVSMNHGPQMDRVFVKQSIAANQLAADYMSQLSAVAQAPELQAVLETAQGRASAQVARAQQLQSMFAVADSVVADSLARRAAAHRNRQRTNR
ncbi:MAG TPA: DUF4142 domain-containing protein [Gemmatimonadaceae bacterium]|nr:DUF4142 domain-containing protein [Gemmatimonadaceae bacterium]